MVPIHFSVFGDLSALRDRCDVLHHIEAGIGLTKCRAWIIIAHAEDEGITLGGHPVSKADGGKSDELLAGHEVWAMVCQDSADSDPHPRLNSFLASLRQGEVDLLR